MASVDCNVELFSQHIKEVVAGLQARGESTDELVVNLFKAYRMVGDSEFSRYMKNKRDSYDDGEDVQADPLMSVVLAKSQSLIEYGVWNMMSPDQERLVALLSEVKCSRTASSSYQKTPREAEREKSLRTKESSKRHSSPSRRNRTRTSGHGRRSIPRLVSPKPNACLGL
jgi:hypothetical protein